MAKMCVGESSPSLQSYAVANLRKISTSLTMQDGFVITINKTTKYYPTEEDFFHNVRTDFPHTYMIENVEKMEYEENKHYEAYRL